MALRLCYAVSGTEVGYAARHARASAVLDSTADGGTNPPIVLRLCYAISGTDRAYLLCDVRCHATRSPVLT
eukprot:744652-Rhodomonas_salina.2